MTKKEAQKLYGIADGEIFFVLYNASPYVAEVESGYIEENDEGEFIYRDSAVIDINLEEENVSDFSVYTKVADWTKLTEKQIEKIRDKFFADGGAF